MRFENEKLTIESRTSLLNRLQARYEGDTSLVDELIAERREEAQRETAEIEASLEKQAKT